MYCSYSQFDFFVSVITFSLDLFTDPYFCSLPQLSEKSFPLYWFISTYVWKAKRIELTNILLLHEINANTYKEGSTFLWFNFHSLLDSWWFNFAKGCLGAYCLLSSYWWIRDGKLLLCCLASAELFSVLLSWVLVHSNFK